MELYATGFNAWNQLRFDSAPMGEDEEPDDVFRLTCVLRDESISGLRAFLSYTRGEAALFEVDSSPLSLAAPKATT